MKGLEVDVDAAGFDRDIPMSDVEQYRQALRKQQPIEIEGTSYHVLSVQRCERDAEIVVTARLLPVYTS